MSGLPTCPLAYWSSVGRKAAVTTPRTGQDDDADNHRGDVACSLGQPRSHQRSTFRIVSDIVGEGGLQSRTMTASGAADSTATSVHAANDVVPDTYATRPTARTHPAINAAFT